MVCTVTLKVQTGFIFNYELSSKQYVQGDQLYMAALFWYHVKRECTLLIYSSIYFLPRCTRNHNHVYLAGL